MIPLCFGAGLFWKTNLRILFGNSHGLLITILSDQSAYDVFESNHLARVILVFSLVQFSFYVSTICYDNRFLQFQVPLIIL